MKKRWGIIGVIVAISGLLLSSTTALALDPKYEYLEDMSVKELRELDSAIHEVLGDDGQSAGEAQQTSDLTKEETFVIAAAAALKDYLVNPASLQINHAYFGHQDITL